MPRTRLRMPTAASPAVQYHTNGGIRPAGSSAWQKKTRATRRSEQSLTWINQQA